MNDNSTKLLRLWVQVVLLGGAGIAVFALVDAFIVVFRNEHSWMPVEWGGAALMLIGQAIAVHVYLRRFDRR